MIQPRRDVLAAPTAHHGAFDYDELEQLGLSPDEVLDFSVNSNPYGPPPGVREALSQVPLERYPDRECLALRRKLAEYHHVNIENTVVGNGTAEILQLIAFAFLQPGDGALIVEPTFSEYARVAGLAGAALHRLVSSGDFRIQPGAIEAALAEHQPKMMFLCNPNNPTGTIVNPDTILAWAGTHPTTLFVIDEAYSNFAKGHISALRDTPDNILVVRSLTKDFALAGLRLGYAVGTPAIIETVAKLRPAWNVNGMAQAAGLVVLEQQAWLNQTMLDLHDAKRDLLAALQPFEIVPSHVNYFLMRVGSAADFRARLLKHGVMVRDCTSFGLPEYVRIATRTPDENARLIEAVRSL